MARLRTFIAVVLNDAIRHKAVVLQKLFAQAGSKVKWVEPENLHVTMLFLGEVDAREVLDVCKAVRAVTSQTAPFEIQVAGVGGFPNLRRPRTLWIGVEEGAARLVLLHHEIEKQLLALRGYRREDREYTPHITLGRVRGDDLTSELHAALTKQAQWRAGSMSVVEIHVLSSELSAEGPSYTVLSREKLQGRDDSVE